MLEDFRIIELGQVIAGTVGGMIFADMGAEVIKVEPPSGDLGRNPAIAGIGEVSGIFLTFNRGKKSIVIDLKTPEGKEIFLDLVAVSDAIIVNFRPGTMERLGLGFETLRKRNPEIVFVESSGFGQKSPWHNLPAFDIVQQAMSGHMSITGEPGRPPVRNGTPTADLSTALYCALACMAGLLGRTKKKAPAHLEVPMFDVQLAMLGYIGTMYLTKGDLPEPPGSAHEYMVPYQAFPTKTINVVLAPREDRFWKKMVTVMEVSELAEDPRFATNDLRAKNRDELIPTLEKIMRTRTAEEWVELFSDAEVPCAPVNPLDRALENQHVRDGNLIREFDYPGAGHIRMVDNPIRDLFSGSKHDTGPAPTLGRDTKTVLLDTLSYSPGRVEDFFARGIVAGPTTGCEARGT
jgi:crotonobetainyl-CoA:carnitine CoA-transferase CaiB-like acyl-CoA transferase